MSFHPALTLTAFDPPDLAPRAEPDGLRALRREYASKLRRAHETILSLDNLLAPQDWLDAGDGFGARGWRLNRPAQRTQDRTLGPLSYLSEEEWRQHVALARDLCTRNHLALGFRDHVSNFIGPVQVSFVLRGSNPGATSSGPRDADGDGEPDVDPLVAACTRAWEEWCALAEWGQGEDDREEECRRRLLVEGEATVRFFVGDEESGGLPYVRHVEPELIRTPPGASTIDPEGWGVVTAPDDDEREEGLWVCRPENTSEGRLIGSREYVRVKGNVDRTVKRGLSDFFPVGEPLRKVLGLLDNMAHVARLQAAIAWWEQYPTATLDQVATQVRLGADYQRVKVPPTSAGSSVDVTSYEAGTVVRTEGGREVRPGPVSAPNGFEAVERMVLRSVGFRWGCPSYFSGDGDSSFASVLVTGSPFVRITEARQERAKAFGCRVASRVLEFCERSGRLPWGASRRVRPVGVCRPVVIADEEKKARTFLSLYSQNCADPVLFVRSTGADPKVVAANIRAWKKKFDPPAPPGAGAGGGPGVGPGPVPAPPGSAGGDGSSPNVAVGVGLRLDESADGAQAHPEGVPYTGSDGKTYVNVKGADGKLHATHVAAQQNQSAASAPGGTSAALPKVTKKSVAQKLQHLSNDRERIDHIAGSGLNAEATAEAGTVILMGPGAVWQETEPSEERGPHAGAPEPAPTGHGFDVRHQSGHLNRLNDSKMTNESGVTIKDGPKDKLSKMGEALQGMDDGWQVVATYTHYGADGTTLATGFGPGETKAHNRADLLFRPDQLDEWEQAVKDRLRKRNPDGSFDLDAPIPALRLSNELTPEVGKWDPKEVESARALYFVATERLAAIPEYRRVLRAQIISRIAEACQDAVQNEPGGHEAVLKFIRPYLKNEAFAHEVSKVEEIRNAVLSTFQPKDAVKAVSGMPAADQAAVASSVLSGLSDDAADAAGADLSDEAVAKMERILAAAKKRKAGPPPAAPPN